MSRWRWPTWAFVGWSAMLALVVVAVLYPGAPSDRDPSYAAGYAFGQGAVLWLIGAVPLAVAWRVTRHGRASGLEMPAQTPGWPASGSTQLEPPRPAAGATGTSPTGELGAETGRLKIVADPVFGQTVVLRSQARKLLFGAAFFGFCAVVGAAMTLGSSGPEQIKGAIVFAGSGCFIAAIAWLVVTRPSVYIGENGFGFTRLFGGRWSFMWSEIESVGGRVPETSPALARVSREMGNRFVYVRPRDVRAFAAEHDPHGILEATPYGVSAARGMAVPTSFLGVSGDVVERLMAERLAAYRARHVTFDADPVRR